MYPAGASIPDQSRCSIPAGCPQYLLDAEFRELIREVVTTSDTHLLLQVNIKQLRLPTMLTEQSKHNSTSDSCA